MRKTYQLSSLELQSKWRASRITIGIALVVILLCGCSRANAYSAPAPEATPTQTPTELPLHLQLHEALITPPVTPVVTPEPLFKLSGEQYIHPNGFFQLNPPDGWTVQNSRSAAIFSDPRSDDFLSVSAYMTGSILDAVSFKQLVFARERNIFSSMQGYLVSEWEDDVSEGLVTVTKSLAAFGKNWIVITEYRQAGKRVFATDLWVDTNRYRANDPSIKDLLASVDLCSVCSTEIVLDRELEMTGQSFRFENGILALQLPSIWRADHSSSEYSTVDTFYSPDNCAVIQAIVYNDGEPVGRTVAGKLALELLSEYYGNDIRVNDDVVMNGKETLSWYSGKGEFHGSSIVETQGNSILLITQMVENRCKDIYRDLLDDIWGTVE